MVHRLQTAPVVLEGSASYARDAINDPIGIGSLIAMDRSSRRLMVTWPYHTLLVELHVRGARCPLFLGRAVPMEGKKVFHSQSALATPAWLQWQIACLASWTSTWIISGCSATPSDASMNSLSGPDDPLTSLSTSITRY